MQLDLHDQIGRMIYFLGSHEPLETERVRDLIRPDWVVMIVGAQIGFYTLLAARRIDPQRGHVYAIEPNPSALDHLRHHVWLNDVPHVTVVPKAVGDRGETIHFYPGPSHNTGLASTFDRGFDTPAVLVEQTTIDHLADEFDLDRLDFMKVDAEGCEAAVLEGASRTLRRFHPTLLLELNDRMLRRAGASSRKIVTALQDLGYRLFESTGDDTELSLDAVTRCAFLNVLAMHSA
jgi:FkbM family methyltransferase